jgi:HEAT repeat protein
MPSIEEWMQKFASSKREVKLRAARALLHRADECPLWLLIEILQNLSREGWGAQVERALLRRRDAELVPTMIGLLESSDPFVREAACNVLGRSANRAAAPRLLGMIDDPHLMVRRAAGFGLACLKDPSCLPELRRLYERHRDDDANVVMALKSALRSLGENEP